MIMTPRRLSILSSCLKAVFGIAFVLILGAGQAYAQCLPGVPCIVPATPNLPLVRGDGPSAPGSPNQPKATGGGTCLPGAPDAGCTCDADFMNQIYARAWLEGQREMIKAEVLIRKPDSILEYTCFNQFVDLAVTRAAPLFSETTRWTGDGVFGSNEKIIDMKKYALLSPPPNPVQRALTPMLLLAGAAPGGPGGGSGSGGIDPTAPGGGIDPTVPGGGVVDPNILDPDNLSGNNGGGGDDDGSGDNGSGSWVGGEGGIFSGIPGVGGSFDGLVDINIDLESLGLGDIGGLGGMAGFGSSADPQEAIDILNEIMNLLTGPNGFIGLAGPGAIVSGIVCLPHSVPITSNWMIGWINWFPVPCVGINVYMGPDKLETTLEGLVRTSLRNYIGQNFSHRFLGGAAISLDYIEISGAGGYNCNFMDQVYFLSKCTDIVTDDRFWKFSELIDIDPRVLPEMCTAGTKITQDMIDLSENRDHFYVNFDHLWPNHELFQHEGGAVGCTPPVPTGVITILRAYDMDSQGNVSVRETEPLPDMVCVAPNCHYNGDICEP